MMCRIANQYIHTGEERPEGDCSNVLAVGVGDRTTRVRMRACVLDNGQKKKPNNGGQTGRNKESARPEPEASYCNLFTFFSLSSSS